MSGAHVWKCWKHPESSEGLLQLIVWTKHINRDCTAVLQGCKPSRTPPVFHVYKASLPLCTSSLICSGRFAVWRLTLELRALCEKTERLLESGLRLLRRLFSASRSPSLWYWWNLRDSQSQMSERCRERTMHSAAPHRAFSMHDLSLVLQSWGPCVLIFRDPKTSPSPSSLLDYYYYFFRF